jgi:hypothetical protein
MRVTAPVDGGANRSPPGDGPRQLAAAVLLEDVLEDVPEDVPDEPPEGLEVFDEPLEPDFSEDAVELSEDFSDVDDDSEDLPFDELLESLR